MFRNKVILPVGRLVLPSGGLLDQPFLNRLPIYLDKNIGGRKKTHFYMELTLIIKFERLMGNISASVIIEMTSPLPARGKKHAILI